MTSHIESKIYEPIYCVISIHIARKSYRPEYLVNIFIVLSETGQYFRDTHPKED